MPERHEIQTELLKLATGDRLLRLTELHSGMSLEQKLDPQRPLVAQKARLSAAFEAALARAELNPA